MKKKKRIYNIITFIFFAVAIITLILVDKTNKINLSLIVELLIIIYLIKITYGCSLYIVEKYKEHKYSYAIIMNLALMLFLVVNIIRHICLLFINFGNTSVNDIYKATLESFSYFAVLVLPFIIILSIYSVITNIVLIKKEGFRLRNMLGVVFGIIVILGTLASQTLYIIIEKLPLSENQILVKKFIDLSINSVLTYFYCLTLATLYSNYVAAKHIPKYDKDFVIILGCQVAKDGTLTPLLKGRVDKAIEFGKNQMENNSKEVYYIPSGGKGNDEVISEAEAIKNYLIENGISESRIIVEDKSTTTKENMKFSKDKIDEIKKDSKIAFATTSYHVFRSGVIAENEGISAEGMGSKTKWYFYLNSLLREFFANLVTEKGRHIGLIVIINISTLILVLIGYYFNLI